MKRYMFFCDESGNSGSNFLDQEQPIFVLAGWALPRQQRHAMARLIKQTLTHYAPDSPEVKSSVMLRNKKGQQTCFELFKSLGSLGAIPIFFLVEKRFMAALKIVETFLDPNYNDRLEDEFTWETKAKKEIAQIIYALPSSVIDNFADVYRNPSLQTIDDFRTRLCAELEVTGQHSIAETIHGTIGSSSKILDELTYVPSALPNKAMESINFHVFIATLQLIENIGRKIGASFEFYHDSARQFQLAYPEAFNWLTRGKNAGVQFQNGDVFYTRLESVKDFSMLTSSDTPLIQAADLLAGSLCKCLTLLHKNEPVSDGLKTICAHVWGALFVEELPIARMICSLEFYAKLRQNWKEYVSQQLT